jgi:hypothetical protein
MTCPSHSPWLDYSNYAWRRVQVHSHYKSIWLSFHWHLFDKPRTSYTSFPVQQSLYCSTLLYFSLLRVVQTGSAAQPNSYPMGTGSDFSGGIAEGAWSWPPSSI